MSGSTFGRPFTVTTWGESHGKALGVVVDGVCAGLPLNEEDIQVFLNRRRPGQSKFTTKRLEDDRVEILSGVFKGMTTGTPVSMLVWNKDHHSVDYDNIKNVYRPGHADYTFDQKYGFRDYRGGGRSSGRETIGRVAAGAVAVRLLEELGIHLTAYAKSIGPVSVSRDQYHYNEINENPLYMPNNQSAAEAADYLETCIKSQNSAGGIIECVADGLPAGIGEPVFDKLDACLAQAVMSIGAVKGVEFGDGFAAAASCGSRNNDSFTVSEDGVRKATNHSGGILGGISDGSRLILRAAIKPTPSIARPQASVSRDGEPVNLEIKGRHDPVIVPRAVVVVESMCAITLADLLIENMSAKLDNLKAVYRRGRTPE